MRPLGAMRANTPLAGGGFSSSPAAMSWRSEPQSPTSTRSVSWTLEASNPPSAAMIPAATRLSVAAWQAGVPGGAHSTRVGSFLPSIPWANGSGNEPTTAGVSITPPQSWKSHQTRSPSWTRTSVAPVAALDAVDVEEPVVRIAACWPPATPLIERTNLPPKLVVTCALRANSRITVSAPWIFGSGASTSTWAPKSRVTSSDVPPGVSPAPTPQPAATSAATASSGMRARRVISRR